MGMRVIGILIVLFFLCAPLSAEPPKWHMSQPLTGYVLEVGTRHLIIINKDGVLGLPKISNLEPYRLFLAYALIHDQPIVFFAKIVPDPDQSDFHMEIVNPRLVPAKVAQE